MPMMMMVLIFVCLYFVCFTAILLFHKYMNPKFTIILFTITNTILFIGYYINEFHRKGTFEILIFDQISPFMFTMLPLSFLLKDKIKDLVFKTAALLSLGMFAAMLVSPQEAYLGSHQIEASMLYVLDTLLHLNFSLFGVYLFVSNTVKIDMKSIGQAAIFLYSVITFAIICNFLFHKNFFGMGYYSNYGIYMIRIFETYWATLVVYILGVSLVLMLGYEYILLVKKLNFQNSFEYSEITVKEVDEIKIEEKEIIHTINCPLQNVYSSEKK